MRQSCRNTEEFLFLPWLKYSTVQLCGVCTAQRMLNSSRNHSYCKHTNVDIYQDSFLTDKKMYLEEGVHFSNFH